MKQKTGRIKPGEMVVLEGTRYTVLNICRGEGQARTVHRRCPSNQRWFYRTVRGQWCVLKKTDAEPVADYTLR